MSADVKTFAQADNIRAAEAATAMDDKGAEVVVIMINRVVAAAAATNSRVVVTDSARRVMEARAVISRPETVRLASLHLVFRPLVLNHGQCLKRLT